MVRGGKMVHYDVNVKGEPEPEITWSLKEKQVFNDDHYEIVNQNYNTKFTIKDSLRKHSGLYEIMAKNQHGMDKEVVEITVLASPSRPKGPLEVKDVTKDGCKLKWKKPDDDGGKPITGYVLEKYDQKVGRWVPIGKTPGTAEEFDVTGLQEGQHYKFRVKAVNDEGESEPLETEEYTIAKNPFDVPKAPIDVVINDWDNSSVTLQWKRPYSDGGAAITGYFIEKKERGETKWEPALTTHSPECQAKLGDLPEKHIFQFRVSAINKAGTGEASDPTNYHTIKHRNRKYSSSELLLYYEDEIINAFKDSLSLLTSSNLKLQILAKIQWHEVFLTTSQDRHPLEVLIQAIINLFLLYLS